MKRIYTYGHEQVQRNITIGDIIENKKNGIKIACASNSISDTVNSMHTCYFVDRSDEVCIRQLLKRGNPKTDTVEMFHAITKYFVEPTESENINVVKV